MITNDSLPLRHLDRVYLIFSGNLPDRFDAHQSFESNFGFQGTRVPFAFSFAHGPALFSCPAEPEKSNLAHCPKFGVHFWVTDKTIVIPGHGPVGDKSGLIEFRDMLVTVRDKVAVLKQHGKSLEGIVAAAPAADYEAKWGGFFINGKTFTSLVYAGV